MSMKDPVNYEVGGNKYVTIPLTGRKAMRLDKLVTPIIFQLGRKAAKLTKADLAILLCEKMSELSEERFEEIRSLTFDGTMFAGNDKEKSFSLDSEEFYDHFEGRLIEMYNVFVEAWGAHKLTPFRMMAGPSTEETASQESSLTKGRKTSKA